ncbi:MAG: polyprenyl synthetase family protein, partial [Candidatus Marsarchaeota archaeon]|nr:polyprenyl synthetase family protein [Candidatus Marsarchaeota archaeon]
MRAIAEPAATVPEEIMEDLRSVDERLSGLGTAEFIEDGLYAPSMHLIKGRGKMLRPALVFMGGIYAGYSDTKDLVDVAVAVELLHTSSLIHDDIIDKDVRRRGVESTHVRYGNELALLAGDALISSAIRHISGYGRSLINIMARTAMEMSAGEALDFRFQRSGTVPTIREYERIAYLKSASLISTSASIAASY